MYDRMNFFFSFSRFFTGLLHPLLKRRGKRKSLRVCQCVKVNYTPKEDQLQQGKSLSLLNGRKYLQMIWPIISNIYKQLIQLNIKNTKPNLKMGRKTKQTFFQKRNADGQQAYEKLLSITNHQGNSNQNHGEISPHTCQNGYHQKQHK